MKAFDFMPDMTTILAENQEEFFPLPVIKVKYKDGDRAFISAWKPLFIDKIRLLFGKPVYLVVMSDTPHPPVLLTTDGDEIGLDSFEKEQDNDREVRS